MGFNIWGVLVGLPCVLIALALHEYGHAAMADKLGDPTPRAQKRLTLNPLAHLDPLGTLMIALMTITGFPGFGWGKPVITNPLYYRNYRQGRALVALAGPAVNLALAMFGIAIAYLVYLASNSSGQVPPEFVQKLLFFFVAVNFGLMFFNLIPIPPLDGHHVLAVLLPPDLRYKYDRIGMAGILFLLVMLWTGVIGFIFQLNFGIVLWLLSTGFGPGFAEFLLAGAR